MYENKADDLWVEQERNISLSQRRHSGNSKMKVTTLLMLFGLLSLAGCAQWKVNHYRTEVNACLPDDNPYFRAREGLGDIALMASLKEEVEFVTTKWWNWETRWCKVVYHDIDIVRGHWKHEELSFLCKTKRKLESGMIYRLRLWPFREDVRMLFEIDQVDGKYLIIAARPADSPP